MKFIHAADIHLGSPFQGLKNIPTEIRKIVIDSTGKAFQNLIKAAIANQVDFVCIVGDLFDNPEPDLETLNIAIDGFEELNQADIAVFLSYGNHDYINSKIPSDIFPNNIHVFGSEVETKSLLTQDGTKVGITSFSYDKRAEVAARIEEYPLKGSQFDYQIGMLHGSMDGLKSTAAHYAPFTINQLLTKNYDYWGLGHIHKRQELNQAPIVAYAGNTQGRHINEPGIKGVSLVTVDHEGQNQIEFLKTNVVEWINIDVRAEENLNLSQLLTKILKSVLSEQNTVFKLVNINLLGSNVLTADILEELNNGLALSQLQKQLDQTQMWIYRISPKIDDQVQIFSELDQEFWEDAKTKVFNGKKIQEKLGRLKELDFIADQYVENLDLATIQEQVELMLKQRNALGDD